MPEDGSVSASPATKALSSPGTTTLDAPRQRWGSMHDTPQMGPLAAPGSEGRRAWANITPGSTPNLGPQMGPMLSARGRGSVSGGGWQLVEVSNAELSAARNRSTPPSPMLGPSMVGRSPATRPAQDPKMMPPVRPQPVSQGGSGPPSVDGGEGAGDWDGNWCEDWSRSWPGQWRRRGGGRRRQRWRDGDESAKFKDEEADVIVDEDGFDATTFVGEWLDNLGHQIFVMPSGAALGRPKGGGKGKGRVCYLATLHKPGVPDKRFNISRDKGKQDWTCGNGVLVRQDSSVDYIVFKAADGRISSWTRRPPEGPVYFDAPPGYNLAMQAIQGSSEAEWGMGEGGDFMLPQAGCDGTEWKVGEDDAHQEADNNMNSAEAGRSSSSSAVPTTFNASAPEFVPSAPSAPANASPAHASAASPQVAPASAPVLAPAAPVLTLSEESPDVVVSGNRLEWTLPDAWGKLSRFPKDFCITSPMFGVRQAATMQLVFYPSGSKAAEAGHCTVALTRGPDSAGSNAGIKFEFGLNGRSSGPKVCLGRRYLGDYPKPCDDSEGSKTERVRITMQVLEVLGGPGS